MKKRYIVFANKRRRAIRASKDYATLRGMDFKKAKDILTKDGFYEHEYGDKDNNNGYAVYRKGDKEVELTYKWEKGTRKDQYNAGKILDVYVDEDINSATKVRSRRAIKASGRKLIFPFLVEGEFADGYTCEVGGDSEAECIEKLGNMENMHGELVWYGGVTDENYDAGKSVYSSSNVRRVTASVDDAEVDLTFIGEPSAIMDLKNAALSAGDTITRFNANTIIIHTWDYAVDEYMEYANELGLSVDDVSYVNSAKKITCSYEDNEAIIQKKEQDFIKFAKAHPSTPSLIIDKYIDNQETCSYYYGMEFDEDGSIFDSLPDACKNEMYRRYDNGEYDDYDDEDDPYWETGVGRDE